MFVSCRVFVLSGRGLCEGPIPRPEESYRLWCVSECDVVTSKRGRPRPDLGCLATGKKHGVGSQHLSPVALPREKNRCRFYSRLGGPGAGLNGCGKFLPHRDSIPALSSS
jgi:hypothetical protein